VFVNITVNVQRSSQIVDTNIFLHINHNLSSLLVTNFKGGNVEMTVEPGSRRIRDSVPYPAYQWISSSLLKLVVSADGTGYEFGILG
jgi:hypothetical protein